ncbi:MAG TPA: histidinol-phosphate transaminase [Bacteroidales bacterium]|nr:histidinol-phosphate transaminase [Bacteroidales bacterium]
MTDLNKLVRENVKALVPYSCARDEFRGKAGIFLDANENPYGKLNRYPDPHQSELKSAVSKLRGIAEANIFIGNGSDEIIDLCYRIFCNPGTDKALIFSPSYGMYEVAAAINDVKIIRVPLNVNFQIDMEALLPFLNNESLKLIFICSPNNPTGNCMKKADIKSILSQFEGIVIVDEAYNDFNDHTSFIHMIGKYSNLIVIQTFSKALGLAAARIGMAFADEAIIGFLNKIKPPYNVSVLNQRAALKRLNSISETEDQIKRIRKERDRLSFDLQQLGIVIKIYPSDSNFLLVKVTDATSIYNELVDNRVIVRNRTTIVDNCLRITVGTRYENSRLVKVLKNITI